MSARKHLLTDVALGVVAGLAGTWVMNRVTTFLYEREDPRARQREDAARHGQTAYGIAVEKAAAAVGAGPLPQEQQQKLGQALHWALGVGGGALYGALRGRVPAIDAGQGLAYGTAFWGVVDEGANTALGLTPPPAAFPWQAHARGLAGHLAYAVVIDSVLDAADRLRH
jgi:uncharacterized membrane protein YagU involved in acid resistance